MCERAYTRASLKDYSAGILFSTIINDQRYQCLCVCFVGSCILKNDNVSFFFSAYPVGFDMVVCSAAKICFLVK